MRYLRRLSPLAVPVVTLLIFAWFIHAWRTDRPEIVTPANSAIQTAVDADLYALLARGFLHGHLFLDTPPPAALVVAANPYDPTQRPPVLYLHDASLFAGHYYLYFGPAPAALVYAPWRLATGHDLPTPWAVFLFVGVGFVGARALIEAIRRQCFPTASPNVATAAVVTLGSATLWLMLVRRPSVYEAAIAFGSAAVMWAWYCAWQSRTQPRGETWAAACGALLGLAIAARPTFGSAAIPALLLMANDSARTRWLRLVAHRRVWSAAAAGAVCIAALLTYNHARFGDWLEFGQKYQLSSQNEGAIQHFSLRFWPAQAWFYLVAPLRLSAFFPFVSDAVPLPLPRSFGSHEYSFGVLSNLPVLWFGAFALVASRRRPDLRTISVGFAAGAILALVPLLTYFGSCVRYEIEFAAPLALLAATGMLAADAACIDRPRQRRRIGWIAITASVLGWTTVFFASIDMYDATTAGPPPAFDGIGRWLDRPLVAWQSRQGKVPGPIELTIVPGKPGEAEPLIVATGPNGAVESLTVLPLDAQTARFTMRREGPSAYVISGTTPLAAGRPHVVRASFGSLYPMRSIEMPIETTRERFRSLRLWVRIDVDGKRIIDQPSPPPPWRTNTVALAPAAHVGSVRFTGHVITARRVELPPATARANYGGIRLHFASGPMLAGHSVPLAVTGYQGRGDFLFARFGTGSTVQFGYDHWGKPVLEADAIPLTEGPHMLEIWMPSMYSPEAPAELVLRLDGKIAWRTWVPFYRAGTEEFFVGRNPLGGSSCETEFSGVTIDRTDLPRL